MSLPRAQHVNVCQDILATSRILPISLIHTATQAHSPVHSRGHQDHLVLATPRLERLPLTVLLDLWNYNETSQCHQNVTKQKAARWSSGKTFGFISMGGWLKSSPVRFQLSHITAHALYGPVLSLTQKKRPKTDYFFFYFQKKAVFVYTETWQEIM